VVGVGRTHYLRTLSAESRKWLEGAGPLDLYATAGECFYNSLKEEPGLAFKKTTEAGCQRGTNTYQCWPPLQLNDHDTGAQIHKKHKKRKKQLVYKLTRVQRERQIR